MKQKEHWVCSDCGNSQVRWAGSCSSCKSWNTLQRFLEKTESKFVRAEAQSKKPQPVCDVQLVEFERSSIGFVEADRVFGGGVVTGSLTLLGGDPGIGKSTLMLQLSHKLCEQGKKVLYVCGEESCEQTSLRAQRLGIQSPLLYLFAETVFSRIQQAIDDVQPDVLVIDSVQIVYKNELPSLPGSVTQVKEIAMECMHIAKRLGITTFVIGHVTKSGELAGPKVLEHIVDTVLDFEGDMQQGYRILRARKNRFGPTDEIALFHMEGEGLVEVQNPSQVFLAERISGVVGSVIIPTLEGSRSILIEVQALVAPSSFATASRRSTGLDGNRLALLLAVLEKRMGYHFHNLDVFVSIAGGIKITEPAIDLGILLAIASSLMNKPVDPLTVIMGEVGLNGEVRSIPRLEQRIREAKQMGFTTCVVPQKSMPKKSVKGIALQGVTEVNQVIDLVLP